MGYMDLKIKLMPSSPDTDLEEIKDKARKLIEDYGGKGTRFEEEPVAFGLKALIVYFTWPEEKELETLENSLETIENVSSNQVLDMRKAIG